MSVWSMFVYNSYSYQIDRNSTVCVMNSWVSGQCLYTIPTFPSEGELLCCKTSKFYDIWLLYIANHYLSSSYE